MKQKTAMQMQESATLKAGQGCSESEHACKIEKQEIDDVTVEETVGQISQYAGQKQRERNIAPADRADVGRSNSGNNENERDAGKRNEKQVVVLERTESRAGIRHVHEMKEIGNDGVGIGRDRCERTTHHFVI